MAAKLREAREVYEKDSETIHWFVMQDVKDATKFTIVERFEKESSQEEHLSNPYWASASSLSFPTSKALSCTSLSSLDVRLS